MINIRLDTFEHDKRVNIRCRMILYIICITYHSTTKKKFNFSIFFKLSGTGN